MDKKYFQLQIDVGLRHFIYVHESIPKYSPICASMRVDIPPQDVRTNNLPVPNPCVVIAIFIVNNIGY